MRSLLALVGIVSGRYPSDISNPFFLVKKCARFGYKLLLFEKVCETSSQVIADRLEENYLQLQNAPSTHQHFPGLRDRRDRVCRVLSFLQAFEVTQMTPPGKRNPRVTVSFTLEELGLISGRCGNQISAYLKMLALDDIGSDDTTCRQFYALGMTLNEALSVVIDIAKDSKGQVPDELINQLSTLREAMKAMQRQAVMEAYMDIPEILQQLHGAIGGNRLTQKEREGFFSDARQDD
ncbi:MAG: hypothetical protein AAF609_16710 [Cyanobacteria bacterium P01_C01_bin.120]